MAVEALLHNFIAESKPLINLKSSVKNFFGFLDQGYLRLDSDCFNAPLKKLLLS